MKGIKVDFIEKKIYMNKTFTKKMSNTSSPEYAEYERVIANNPDFEQVFYTQETYNHDKYKGLTYRYIENYIYCHEATYESKLAVFAEYLEERWKAAGHSCGYKEVRAWFIAKYPEFDNMYFKSHQEPPTDVIAELVKMTGCVADGKMFAPAQQKLLAE